MHFRPIGKTQASVVGFGAWAIGGWMWGGADETDAIRAIHEALDLGMNLIDTAPIYGFGRSEEIVGKAIADRRIKVFLATKCGMVWDTDRGEFKFKTSEQRIDEAGQRQVNIHLRPESIRAELEASLQRLQTDHVDLYQTHWQESDTPIEDTMGELERLRNEGKIRAIGVCNASVDQITEYQKTSVVHADQEKYSMLHRDAEQANLPYCAEQDMAFLAYSPLARGLLTGAVTADRKFDEGDQRAHDPQFSVENRKRVQAMLDALRTIAVDKGVTLAQMVLAWTVAQPGCTHALVGGRNPEQVRENAKAADLELEPDELERITQVIDQHTASMV